MYHYIQPFNQKFKKFEFLHFKHFEKQLNFFKKKYVFFDCYELFEKSNKSVAITNEIEEIET